MARERQRMSIAEDAGETTFETVLSAVGAEGLWQRRLCAWSALAPLLMGIHSLSVVVLAAKPEHWCSLPEELTPFNLTKDQYIPIRTDADGTEAYYQCNMFNLTVSAGGNLVNSSGLVACAGWDFDLGQYGATTAVVWQLVCWRSTLIAVIQSSFMLAVLMGFLVAGMLSDVLGRRPVAAGYSLVIPLTSFAVAAAPSLSAFLALRVLLALTLPGLFCCLMVLCLETVGAAARGVYGIVFQTPFAIGLMLAAAAAHVTSAWWQTQLLLSLPALLLPLLVCVLPESPRWLLGQGRIEEAVDVLLRMASANGKPVDRDRLARILESCYRSETQQLLPAQPTGGFSAVGCCSDAVSDIARLFTTPRMRRISLACFWCLFVDGLAAYGIPENAAQLGGVASLALLLSGAVELVADAVSVLLVGSLGRRPTVSMAQLATALPSLLLLLLPVGLRWARLALAMLARCAVAIGLNVLAFYSAELFPTVLRSTGFGAGATVSRLGAVLAPMLVGTSDTVHWGLPSGVFGACALTAAGVALLLPETRGKRLPETVEDVEHPDQ